MWLELLPFGAALSFTGFLLTQLRRRTVDGWTYPLDELRWFIGATSLYLFLTLKGSPLPQSTIWSGEFHLFSTQIALSVLVWSLSALLLKVRFQDRACIERHQEREPGPAAIYARLCDISLLVVMSAGLLPIPLRFELILSLQAITLALALAASVRSTEWRRVLKRSGVSPLAFHATLLMISAALTLHTLARATGFAESATVITFSCWAALLSGSWRSWRFLQASRRARTLAAECRRTLSELVDARDRLTALCSFIEDEWCAARVSVISVDGRLGLMLASAGPEAIPDVEISEPRPLGPFLRRVCRAGHILYAPVAEELGQDLRDQGLKHSSLAVPFLQRGQIRAVLCMMADEGERIAPIEATTLEMLLQELSLEILSCVAQHVAEEKFARILNIARQADGIAVEHLDSWGHLQYPQPEEERFLVGAKVLFSAPKGESLVIGKAKAEFRRELRAVWQSLAQAYEFLLRETKEDCWVLSPKEFRQPFLADLGPARAALLLAAAMERQARALAAKDEFLMLAQPPLKILAGETKLLLSNGGREASSLDLGNDELNAFRAQRERVPGHGFGYWGSLPPANPRFQLAAIPLGQQQARDFSSILRTTADKREIRKIENKALEAARETLRRAA